MLDDAMMRPGRFDRVVYVPPPDKDSRRKIFGVYLDDNESVLAGDVDTEILVDTTEGYVGADIEALIREAKLGAMREFITAMRGKSDHERSDALANVRVTKKHFEDAMKKVKATLDQEAIEKNERLAWSILYNEEERSVLEKAGSVLTRAGFGHQDNAAVQEARKTLRNATFGKKNKDLPAIKEQTEALERLMES